MTLTEFRETLGIKRIDFGRVKATELETQYASDELICPYCGRKIDYDSEEIEDILHGEAYPLPLLREMVLCRR